MPCPGKVLYILRKPAIQAICNTHFSFSVFLQSSHWTNWVMSFIILLSATNTIQSHNDLHQQSSLQILINPQNLLGKYCRKCLFHFTDKFNHFQRLHGEFMADLGYSLRNFWILTVLLDWQRILLRFYSYGWASPHPLACLVRSSVVLSFGGNVVFLGFFWESTKPSNAWSQPSPLVPFPSQKLTIGGKINCSSEDLQRHPHLIFMNYQITDGKAGKQEF